MPFDANGLDIIRANLTLLQAGVKPQIVTIGSLTAEQYSELNIKRTEMGLPALASNEIIFRGRHIYESRVVRDGYTIDDVCDQIESALSANSVVLVDKHMSALEQQVPRSDRYGNHGIKDRAVFEMTAHRPKAELFSVIPKHDKNKPPKP